MNQVLPRNYVFNAQQALTPNKVNGHFWKRLSPKLKWLFYDSIPFLMSMILLIQFYSNHANNITYLFSALLLIITGCWLIYFELGSGLLTADQPKIRPYQPECVFKLSADSNLLVMQDETNYPNRLNEHQGYPYQLYAVNAKANQSLIYLGKTNNVGQLQLSHATKTSYLFANYYYYMQKHHLNDKFANKLYFVKDPQVTNANDIAQYVLKGDGITLKTESNKNQTNHIYVVTE